MGKTDSSWSLLYVGVAIFGAYGGHMFAKQGPVGAPTDFLFWGGLGSLVFTAATVFGGLQKRLGDLRDHSVLDVKLWASAPTNPQSNRFAQVIFFSAIGITAIFEARCPIDQSVGFLPLSMGVGIAIGLLIFRLMYRRQLRQAQQKKK